MKRENEAVDAITTKQHEEFHTKIAAFFRKRGLETRDYRQKGAKIINEIKRRKALEMKTI